MLNKKTICKWLLLGVLPLWGGGCQSVGEFSIDYQVPAEVSFPPAFRRVGIVNNLIPEPGDTVQTTETKTGDGAVATICRGQGALAAEALAQLLADANHFDEVIICDSALRQHDAVPQTEGLQSDEVMSLTHELGVVFLISLEDVHILSRKKVTRYSDIGIYEGTIDALVSPLVRIYAPGRKGPMVTLHPVDSIYWETTTSSLGEAMGKMPSTEEIRKQASDFAGEMVVKHLVPYWKSAPRSYYIGSGVAMRDAAVCVHEADWEKAVGLWKQSYQAKSAKTRMQAAYNIALGYEMQDSLSTALEWARKAQQIAGQIDKVEEKRQEGALPKPEWVPNYIKASAYVTEMKQRASLLPLLQMQTKGSSE